MKVAVCVVTYRRPEELARLLIALGRLQFDPARVLDLEVVVVDNDALRSAEATCVSSRPRVRWPIHYEVEPRRGIAVARNRAVQRVRLRTDFVAFIDDDEAPEANWLEALLCVQSIYDADVVAGPVLPRLEAPAPQWIIRGGFFDRPRYFTGHRLRHAATNNVLVRANLFANERSPFDERLALRGGEDTHFFLRTTLAGHSIVWANEAVVHEWIPRSRMSARWLLRRSYRVGNTWSFCERDLYGTPRVLVMRVVKAAGRIAGAICLLPLSFLSGRHATVAVLRHMCQGAGYLTGLIGMPFEEYRTALDR
jgi:succinoglycan biosynthesis protein ExoM